MVAELLGWMTRHGGCVPKRPRRQQQEQSAEVAAAFQVFYCGLRP
jgi:hypothetical protein